MPNTQQYPPGYCPPSSSNYPPQHYPLHAIPLNTIPLNTMPLHQYFLFHHRYHPFSRPFASTPRPIHTIEYDSSPTSSVPSRSQSTSSTATKAQKTPTKTSSNKTSGASQPDLPPSYEEVTKQSFPYKPTRKRKFLRKIKQE
ncbi:hypothetical protein EB796_013097 [Bugula neritina]|uniref:Uncharacterized protein n=1 Tax=Bugula neritina TaxID=10212 RepID=A0A7J7JSH7_BUGNE|nr:hypothetical protein EB796_013097 [Bugula neritina]